MLDRLTNSESPPWVLYVSTLVVFFLLVEIAFRVARRRRSGRPELKDQLGTVLTALLGLLGFLLAISFGIAADKFGQRKAVVLEEANAISTAYLRTSFLPEPQRTEMRRRLAEYVDLRLAVVLEGVELESALPRVEALHREMWQLADAVAEARPASLPVSLFIEVLNEVIDLHEARITVSLRYRVPAALMYTLYLVALISMATLGAYFGVGNTRNPLATLALLGAFAGAILIVAELDRPSRGLFQVSQGPLQDTQEMIRESLREPPRAGAGDAPEPDV